MQIKKLLAPMFAPLVLSAAFGLMACGDDSSSANDSQKGSGAVGGACKGDAYASEIDRNQNTITLHHIKYRTECDVQGPVPTFASVGIAQDLVYD